jgi:predicted dehydrogenase
MLRIGVLGCGGIARAAHLPSLARIGEARVVALADGASDRLNDARRLAPGALAFADYAELLEMADVDAVIIALPPALHTPATIASLERGKHVYVEKPLAISLDEGRRVLDVWKGTTLTGMMGFNYRRNPIIARARSLIAAGAVGTPVAARTVFSTRSRTEPDWKRARTTGGGVLLDLSVHHIDLIRFLLGAEVREVAADLASRVSENDTAFLRLGLTSECIVQSFFSFETVEEDRIEIYGTKAKLTVDRYRSLRVEVTGASAEGALGAALRRAAREWSALPYALRKLRAPLHELSFRESLRAFVRSASRGESVSPDLYDGYRALAVVEAAESSMRSSRPVAVDDQHEGMASPALAHAAPR